MAEAHSQAVTLMEVSPRDGLQNEQAELSTEDKLVLIQWALDAGAKRIEVTSFVHPKKVPRMADAEACLLYTSPSPRDQRGSRMPSSA